jgi:hypothetical protein
MTAKKLFNRFCAILIGSASLATGQIDPDVIVVEPVDPFIPDVPFIPDIPPIQFDFDYGDAPDPSYPTLHINDGARHLVIAPVTWE